MIKKGFSVGDIFTDGGRRFKVIRVLENGDYISEAVNFDMVSDELGEMANSGTADDDPDETTDSGTVDDDPGETADDATGREDADLNAGRYTKRQIQRMNKVDTFALAGELGIVVSGTTTEIKEAILKDLGL